MYKYIIACKGLINIKGDIKYEPIEFTSSEIDEPVCCRLYIDENYQGVNKNTGPLFHVVQYSTKIKYHSMHIIKQYKHRMKDNV